MKRLVAFVLMLGLAAPSLGQQVIQLGEKMPDFPPGFFTDGGKYQLADFQGKVLVLYFFEKDCPRCAQMALSRNEVVKSFLGKPVAFVGIIANAAPAEALAYRRDVGLAMPIFCDNLGVMQARYGFTISNENIWQTRVLDPDGRVMAIEFTKEAIQKVLDDAKPSQTFAGIAPAFSPLVAPLEHGQLAMGMKALAAARKSATKPAQIDFYKKIDGIIKLQALAFKKEADEAVDAAPIVAHDLYLRAATLLPNDELGKTSFASAKKLASHKNVAAELAARAAFNKVAQSMAMAFPAQKANVAIALADVGRKHRDTPTGEKAASLAEELRSGDKKK